MGPTRLARRRGFQFLHKNATPPWTASAASSVAGNCFTPQGPGHNYELEIYIEGALDPESGMILNLNEVDHILHQAIRPIDGQPVSFPEISGPSFTTARLAQFLWQRLIPHFSQNVKLVKMRLYEYEDLWVDIWSS